MATIPLRDGHKLYVRFYGKGAQPVMLLHGQGMDSRFWLPFIWRWRNQCRFIMPDFRGAGRSSSIPLNQLDVIQNHMEDVQDVSTHLALNQIKLVGYSLGGTVSLHWQRAGGFANVSHYLHIDQSPCTSNKPDWTYGLFGDRQEELYANMRQLEALLESHSNWKSITELPYQHRKQAIDILGKLFSLMAGKPILHPLLRAASHWPTLLQQVLPLTNITFIQANLACYLDLAQDYRDSLIDCPTPVTVMTGMKSPLYHPKGQAEIAKLVREGSIIRFEKSGHAPMFDEPLKFTRELGRFLVGDIERDLMPDTKWAR